MTKDEIINYIKSKYPEDKIHIYSGHINVTRGPVKERRFDHIILINSEEKALYIWWTYFNKNNHQNSIDIHHKDEFYFNDKNLKEQIDKCHESYDNARKELNNYMKELLKNKVSEL